MFILVVSKENLWVIYVVKLGNISLRTCIFWVGFSAYNKLQK